MFTKTLGSGIKFIINVNRGTCVPKLFSTLVTVFAMKYIMLIIMFASITYWSQWLLYGGYEESSVSKRIKYLCVGVCIIKKKVVNNPIIFIPVSPYRSSKFLYDFILCVILMLMLHTLSRSMSPIIRIIQIILNIVSFNNQNIDRF